MLTRCSTRSISPTASGSPWWRVTDGLAALPQVRDPDGSWRRARPGDGAAEALLALLNDTAGTTRRGRFTVQSWAPPAAVGERAVTVDQTNESVIVGDTAVVKWATHLQEGPHPAPRRIEVLRANGFRLHAHCLGSDHLAVPTGPPRRWWSTSTSTCRARWTAGPGRWTWSPTRCGAALRRRCCRAATEVGTVVAELHAALAGTATTASVADADRWRDAAFATLEDARALASPQLRDVLDARQGEVERDAGHPRWVGGHVRSSKATATCTSGRCCAARSGLSSPTSTATRSCRRSSGCCRFRRRSTSPGMTQSLAHVAIVARQPHRPRRGGPGCGRRRWRGRPSSMPTHGTSRRWDTPTCTTPHRCGPSGCSRCCAKSSTRQGICRAGCMYPTRRCPHCSTRGAPGEALTVSPPTSRRKPEVLGRLADTLAAENPWASVVPAGPLERVVLLGMGSSAYAGGVAAARMRARGLVAVSELASSATASRLGTGHARRGDLGQRRVGGDPRRAEPAADRGHHGRADQHGGVGHHPAVRRGGRTATPTPKVGGVACRSYQHTLALLIALELHLAGADIDALADRHRSQAATASAHLLDTEADWRPEACRTRSGARPAPIWPRRRTGSARPSRVP